MVSEGDGIANRTPPSQMDRLSEAAANSFENSGRMSNSGRAGVRTDTFDSNPTQQNEHDTEALKMPKRLNPHENGLRRPPPLTKAQGRRRN